MMNTSIRSGFGDFPKIDLLGAPTPLHRATGLERALKAEGIEVGIHLKRDDVMSIGGGGNKLRKLQYHMAAFALDGHDTVITNGGLQSNHARLTAAVCAKLGIECHLVLTPEVDIHETDYQANGNRWLNRIFGAKSHILRSGESAGHYVQSLADQLHSQGRSVGVIPTGGSTALGALGYAECAHEVLQQAAAAGLNLKNVVVPNGSSGTQAGLIAGMATLDRRGDVIQGFAVMSDVLAARTATSELVGATLELVGAKARITDEEILVDDSQLGSGYGLPTSAMMEAVTLLARTEGVLLDPVYSGKAFAGLIARLRSGAHTASDDLVFVVTGGGPGLFAYQTTLNESVSI